MIQPLVYENEDMLHHPMPRLPAWPIDETYGGEAVVDVNLDAVLLACAAIDFRVCCRGLPCGGYFHDR